MGLLDLSLLLEQQLLGLGPPLLSLLELLTEPELQLALQLMLSKLGLLNRDLQSLLRALLPLLSGAKAELELQWRLGSNLNAADPGAGAGPAKLAFAARVAGAAAAASWRRGRC